MNKKNALYFLPLGGAGEIGMNLNLYGYNDQWLMVDLGVIFYDRLGVDVLMPNPQFIVERRDKLVGLLATHAHEDHIGAIPYIWPLLKCPIYATPFTAELIRRKFKDQGMDIGDKIIDISLGSSHKIGPFEIEMASLTHSIPEPNGLLIKTPAGSVFHTGDWKADPDPLVGEPINVDAMKRIGDTGVTALVCDSTNVFDAGQTGSESDVRKNLIELIGTYSTERLLVSCFASNLARMESIAVAAAHHGRRVCLLGHSYRRMSEVAKQFGYLSSIADFIEPSQAKDLPKNKVLYITSGSQGESRAALSRMAVGNHPDLKLAEDDVVIFSSRVIPGNEKSISALKNKLIRLGVKVVSQHEEDIHVSGHPGKGDLELMYEWIRPKILIPVHGELQHLIEHGRFAKKHGISDVVIPENGSMIRIEGNTAEIVDDIPAGRLARDGNQLVSFDHSVLKERTKLSINGIVFVTLSFDENDTLKDRPQLALIGLVENGDLTQQIKRKIEEAVEDLSPKDRGNDEVIKDKAATAIRRQITASIDKKPLVQVHIVRD